MIFFICYYWNCYLFIVNKMFKEELKGEMCVDRIDFPDKYENLMRLAQQMLTDHQYFQAKELFQRDYELKATFEANRLLVFCLFEINEKKEALNQALPHEKEYLNKEETATFYFDLLIQTRDYLYARKLIASYDFSEAFEQDVLDKIQQSENFMSRNERKKIRDIYHWIDKVSSMSQTKQLLFVSKIEELPYHELVQTINKLIIMPEIHLLVRAKMLELLVEVKNNQLISYLTIDKQVIEVIPATLPKPEKQFAYQKLSILAEKYENHDAYLSSVVKRRVFDAKCASLPDL